MEKTTHTALKTKIWAVIACLVMAMALGGCASIGSSQQGSTTDDEHSSNRIYMASLNQKMGDLQTVLNDFQTAVGQKDTVTMQAQVSKAGEIVNDVKSAEAPEAMNDIKTAYVDGLSKLNDALGAYVTLYNDAQSGTLDQATYDTRLAEVQDTYNQGVEALKSADEQLTNAANA